MQDTKRIIFTPSGRRGKVRSGTTVLEAARQFGVDIDSVCGGRGICTRCQIITSLGKHLKEGVNVTKDALSPINEVERRAAKERGLVEGRRLACQAQIMADLVVDVPVDSQMHRQLIRKRADALPIRIDAPIRTYFVELAEATMERQVGELQLVKEALNRQFDLPEMSCELSALKNIQAALKKGKRRITLAVRQVSEGTANIVEVWPGYYDGVIVGASIDIGSTTIACQLVDMRSGNIIAASGAMNPQIRFGEDLMSRVSYAMMNQNGADSMIQAVREQINALLQETANAANISVSDIFEVVAVGNTVMHHLFFGIDPVELGAAPFALATSEAIEVAAREVGISVHPGAKLYSPPCIAGHVGADAAAVILSEGPHLQKEIMLVVDIGTNAEIILGSEERLLACSSPTGPAFEGGQISSGQRASAGAIERVAIDRQSLEPTVEMIKAPDGSSLAASGICGSGIIEAVAEMRLANIINEDGAFNEEFAQHPRFVRQGRTLSYILHENDSRRLLVTQEDIRAIQLAKAALYAGASLLMEELGVEHVDRIALAGAFGAHISVKHAMILGMIPDCPLDKVSAAGNAAGSGARMALLNKQSRAEIEEVAKKVEKIETALAPRFQELFVEAMAIPHKKAPFPNLQRTVSFPKKSAGSISSRAPGAGRRRRTKS